MTEHPKKISPAVYFVFLFLFSFLFSLPLQAQEPGSEPVSNYIFRDSFYIPPALKIKYDIYESSGFLLVKDGKRGYGSEFAIITDFQDPILESRVLKNIRTIDEAQQFIEKNSRKIFFERVPIRELPLIQKSGEPASKFWVGQKAFDSLDLAKAEIVQAKTLIESQGGNFDRALELITEFFAQEKPAPTPEEIRAQYIAEEELALKVMDWLDAGEQLYGPLMGTPIGERVIWQSFAETSYRTTNLDNIDYKSQVVFWTNRMVFKGIRFLYGTTLDPYVEVTTALESNGLNFPSHLDLTGGIEWRPFARSAILSNANIDGLHVLKFIQNYRLFVQYIERKNLKDEILGSPDTDLWFGADVFYEWGLDLDAPWVKSKRTKLADWIADYSWGEYYGTYHWEKTNFSSVDSFETFVLNSSVTLGLKWPSIPLPPNPINDEFLLMPYIRLEHTTVPDFPDHNFQNRVFLAAGVRWMPFRSYQFENNEWLFKTKLYAEYAGVGGVEFPGPAKPSGSPDRDWRFGVAISYRRF